MLKQSNQPNKHNHNGECQKGSFAGCLLRNMLTRRCLRKSLIIGLARTMFMNIKTVETEGGKKNVTKNRVPGLSRVTNKQNITVPLKVIQNSKYQHQEYCQMQSCRYSESITKQHRGEITQAKGNWISVDVHFLPK